MQMSSSGAINQLFGINFTKCTMIWPKRELNYSKVSKVIQIFTFMYMEPNK